MYTSLATFHAVESLLVFCPKDRIFSKLGPTYYQALLNGGQNHKVNVSWLTKMPIIDNQ